jgi:RNA polymerase sigma-70 factor (ECF subfamily)
MPLPDWEQLYHAHGDRVFRLLHRMTGDPALAEDLTHDCFVRVHESRTRFAGRGSVEAWLFRIAGNIGRDALRVHKAALHRAAIATPPGTPVVPDPVRYLALSEALAALEDTTRTVVLLHDVDGFRHAEIATMLGIAEGSSRSRLSRARRMLREHLSDHSSDGGA